LAFTGVGANQTSCGRRRPAACPTPAI